MLFVPAVVIAVVLLFVQALQGRGGGLAIYDTPKVTLNGMRITENLSKANNESGGGGIIRNADTIVMEALLFEGNYAGSGCGALCIDDTLEVNMSSIHFQGNGMLAGSNVSMGVTGCWEVLGVLGCCVRRFQRF